MATLDAAESGLIGISTENKVPAQGSRGELILLLE